jgi:RNA polymerase sigma factor (TIGR02999 family)
LQFFVATLEGNFLMEAHMPHLSKKSVSTSPSEITLLLSDETNPESLRAVMRLAYGELRGIAAHHCRTEPPGRTWQPTALVNEACIRLIESGTPLKNRRHFFGAASEAMRRILVDSARRRRAQKRGGCWRRVDFTAAEQIGFEQPSELLDLNAALTRLEAVEPRLSEVVKLRVFGGWSTTEIAMILGIGESTTRRHWLAARTWLRGAISGAAK